MATITLGGNTYSIQRHKVEIIESGAAHNLMDGSFRKDVYGTKRRFEIGSDFFTAAELSDLQTSYTSGSSLSFTDLDGSNYTVLFEPDSLSAETNRDIPWSNRRYKVDFALRQT